MNVDLGVNTDSSMEVDDEEIVRAYDPAKVKVLIR